MIIEKIRTAVLASATTTQRISALLALHPEIELARATPTASDLLTCVAKYHPHVVLLEVSPIIEDTIKLLEQIQVQHPKSQCLALAQVLDIAHMRRAVDAGVMGYLLIQSDFQALITAIHLARTGKFTLHPPMAHLLAFL